MVNRATGANVFLRGAFETDYGLPSTEQFIVLSAYQAGLSESQELLSDILLGSGRDPDAPTRGAKDVTGSWEVAADHRRSGFWLRGCFNDTISDDQIGAQGYIDFKVNPVAGSTITLDGVVWTFVASGATGPQTDIGLTLEETLDQLVVDLNLNLAGEAALDAATYSRLGDRLVISHDTADASGNAYTLATNVVGATVSAKTLAGGGFYKHVWHSASPVLPSFTLETFHSDLEPASDRYIIQAGAQVNSLTIARERQGAAKIVVDMVAQSETSQNVSIAGTPTDLPVKTFSNFNGVLLGDDRQIANLVSGNLVIGNELDVVPGLRSDGLIDGADPGAVSIALQLTARFSNNSLKIAADSENPMSIRFGYYDPIEGAELLFEMHEVHLPRPSRQIDGPGGIEVTYDMIGARNSAIGRSITATLINDVPSY